MKVDRCDYDELLFSSNIYSHNLIYISKHFIQQKNSSKDIMDFLARVREILILKFCLIVGRPRIIHMLGIYSLKNKLNFF